MNTYYKYKRLLFFAKPYRGWFVLATAALIASAITEAALPALMKPLIDQGFRPSGQLPIWWVPVAIIFIFLARAITGLVATYAMQRITNSVLRDLREQLFSKLLRLPASFFDQTPSGVLVSRLMTEVNGVLASITTILISLVRDAVLAIGLVAWLFWLNWKLSLVMLLVVPPVLFALRVLGRRMKKVGTLQVAANAELTQVVGEAISANRLIKMFNAQHFHIRQFRNGNERFRIASMKVAIAHALQAPVAQGFMALAIAAIISIGMHQAQLGVLSVGGFISFVTATLMLVSPLRHISEVTGQIQRAMVSAGVIFELLDTPEEPCSSGRPRLDVSADVQSGYRIEFSQVSMRYANRDENALSGVNLTISPRMTTALVGVSGSGKTTVLHLLLRLYAPTSGAIFINGTNIADLDLAALRALMSAVSQDVMLLNATVRENLTYGAPDVSDEELFHILSRVGMADAVRQLPDGLETSLGDRGLTLSGGQRQRLSIARTYLRDTPIVLLDEPTSALDTTSERQIHELFEQIRNDRTTLVAAHRLLTVQRADRIVVLHNGEVQAHGTHQELMERSLHYRDLVDSQLLAN